MYFRYSRVVLSTGFQLRGQAPHKGHKINVGGRVIISVLRKTKFCYTNVFFNNFF